jgi:hypothetical protein
MGKQNISPFSERLSNIISVRGCGKTPKEAIEV